MNFAKPSFRITCITNRFSLAEVVADDQDTAKRAYANMIAQVKQIIGHTNDDIVKKTDTQTTFYDGTIVRISEFYKC